MRTIFTLVILWSMTFSLSAQSEEKTLVKAFNLEGNQVVTLALEGEIEVNQWQNSTMRVLIKVSLENGNDAILKSLVQARRYFLKSEEDEQGMKIFAPGLDKEVSVRGTKLVEKISYIVYAPEDVIVKKGDEATTSMDDITISKLRK
jgi:ethanolamine ammonia-lyase large subunit